MPARILSSVLLPLPFGPMTPKNSPGSTAKLTSSSARFCSNVLRRHGWRKCSLNVVRCSCGIENVFVTPATSMAAGRPFRSEPVRSNALGKPALLAAEQGDGGGQRDERDPDRDQVAPRRAEDVGGSLLARAG